MKSVTFPGGVTLEFPEDWVLIIPMPPVVRRTRRALSAAELALAAGDAPSEDWLAKALTPAGLRPAGEYTFKPPAVPAGQDEVIRVSIRLAEEEGALTLCEQGGWYVWKMAARADGITQVEIAVGQGNNGSLRRGELKVYVFKYTLPKPAVPVGPQIGSNAAPRIIHLRETHPSSWNVVVHLSDIQPPAAKPPRILLLTHGSFGSTRSTFGVLGITPWGKGMLASAIQHYDAVIGFDHCTMVNDPLENAEQLLDLLAPRPWPVMPVIDVIAHGRGALVIRCLLEMLLPKHEFKAEFRRVIFVGAANEGIELAAPGSWEQLAGLYTNLIASGHRAARTLAPPNGLDTGIFTTPLQRIVELLCYCAEVRVSDRRLAGLLAVQTGSALIHQLNETQPGQPSVENSPYFAITSGFKLTSSIEEVPREFAMGFLAELSAGYNVREGTHDLLVNTASMDAIDRTRGAFIRERYDFGENAQVYHTNYFTRPEVANALTRWLALPPVEVPMERVTRGIKDPPVTQVKPLTINWPGLNEIISPHIDTDIICVDANSPASALQTAIRSAMPSWVVVNKTKQDGIRHYAFKGEEALNKLQGDLSQPVNKTFDLDDLQVTGQQQLHTGFRVFGSGNVGGLGSVGSRSVVMFNQTPVGIVPEASPLPDIDQLAATARIIVEPHATEDHILLRRTMPTFTPAGGPDTTRSGPMQPAPPTPAFSRPAPDRQAPPQQVPPQQAPLVEAPQQPDPKKDVLCYFRADMDAEVIVKTVSTIIVTVSREAIAAITGRSADAGGKPVKPDEKLFIRIMPRSKFILLDNQEGSAEIDVPAPGLPQELYFECRAIEEGAGEIWVLVSQGAVGILKLVLRPQAVRTRTQVALINAGAGAERPKPLKYPIHQLRIEEAGNADGIYYKYLIYSQELVLDKTFRSKTIKGDRQQYVAHLYEELEQCWARSANDKENFKEELRAYGAQLFEELIPPGLQEILWTKRNEFGSIQVVSNEPFIPWELVHLREPGINGMPEETLHLAQIGLVRWLEGAGENGWPPDELRVMKGGFRYVIPEYPIAEWQLPQARTEKAFLEKEFNALPVKPASGDVRSILSKPAQFDILHFACHGESPAGQVWSAGLQMQGRKENGKYMEDRLSATMVEQFSNLKTAAGQSPMVFLNACQAGREGYSLTKISGFVEAFITRGAGALVAASWSIGDLTASEFTKTFYQRLKAGDMLSAAAGAARTAVRESGNATWLAYVIYGHPHLQLTFE